MENSDIVVTVVTDLKIRARLYFIYIEKFLFFLISLFSLASRARRARKISRTIEIR